MARSAAASASAAKSGTADPKRSKMNLLDDSESDSDDGGAQLQGTSFKVNEEYAKRFEHNKKREERQKLEDKYKNDTREEDDDDSSSSDETEDEDGFLATEDLDVQISATLHALRTKDPRVYDKEVTFVKLPDDDGLPAKTDKAEKPVFLRDYQRDKLLRGDMGGEDEEGDAPKTYSQEQAALKKSIISEFKAAKGTDGPDDSDSDDEFMKRKEPVKAGAGGVHPSRAKTIKASELDVANADKDPETFLSNFMSARAWVPEEGGRWEAFESDDGEQDDVAEEWEHAYNLRFENPSKSNEFLKSYARDFAAARSVRREERTGRKRQRDLEREKKDEERRQRNEEKARLRKLKLEETEEKLRKVKQAAGVVGKELSEEEWMAFLDEGWENDKWEEEMQKRFGDDYYAVEDDVAASEGEGGNDDSGGAKAKKKGPKKPKWNDDIDIKDIIPDFEDADAVPGVTLSDEGDELDDEGDDDDDDDDDDDSRPTKKRKTADRKRARLESQKAVRQERAKIEALVDSKLELNDHRLLKSNAGATAFRYRETSPQSFGMTARDILLAPSDAALNDFVGLKKLASFRDEEKKRKDRKRLGKKARLREWRRGVFGKEYEKEGPSYGFEKLLAEEHAADTSLAPQQHDRKKRRDRKADEAKEQDGNVVGEVGGSRKKRKRSSGKSRAAADAEA
ncbi:hypothetical protein RJ55_01084 [Drechmeria coniospora]|nr:hypothetical protein RJ55_01084 [Drechmeria coniospora]